MTSIRELLQEARWHIDGTVDCTKPEYVALDALCKAVEAIATKVEEIDKVAKEAAYTASCMANGILPD